MIQPVINPYKSPLIKTVMSQVASEGGMAKVKADDTSLSQI